MAKVNQLKTGVVISYINLLIGNIIPFIYTPIMLNILGKSQYGLYGIASSVMGYLNLLNFGIGSAIIRYLTKYTVNNDKKGEQKMFGLFMFLYTIIAVLIAVIGTIVAFNINVFYSSNLTASELETLKVLLLLMTFNTAVFFPFSLYTSVVLAHEKYIFNKVTCVISTILSPAVNLIMLFMGFATIGLVISSTILNIVMCLLNAVYCHRKLHIKPDFHQMPFNLLKEIFSFSAFIFLGDIVNMLYWSTDKLILGSMVGTVAVAVYNVGATFNNYVQQISVAISGVLIPRINTLVFKTGKQKELSDMFTKVGRLQFLIISFIVSGFIVFGQQFIVIWAGADYYEAFPVALLVMLPVTIPLIQNVGLNIIIAQNKHRFRSIVYAIIAILNVILTVVLIPDFGIIGASIATCIAYILGPVIIMNWYYHKKTGIDVIKFWKNIILMLPVPSILTVLGCIATHFVTINSWMSLFIGILIYSIVFIPLLYLFTMNEYEKNTFKKPVLKILNKIFKRKSQET